MAPPLWTHADIAVGCLDAGKHVLCEKMMAWDVDSCERMRGGGGANNKVLEIGYQRSDSPLYQAAYDGIIKTGTLGDVYHVRLAWHRNGNWRRKGEPPSPDYSPSKWGYPGFRSPAQLAALLEVLAGLFAELCSHQVNAANWFLGAAPEAVIASGGVYRFPEGSREVVRPRLRDLRLSRRPHGDVLVDRVERVRRLLRDVHGHEGHAHHEPASRTRCCSRKAAPGRGRRRPRSRSCRARPARRRRRPRRR